MDALDRIEDPDSVFGSYDQLVADPRFHYEFDRPRKRLDITAAE